MTLQGNELFAAQESEGDAIRRERRQPEPEFVRTCIRYVTIWRSKDTGATWPGGVLHTVYDSAAMVGEELSDGLEVAAVRAVSIDL